MVRTPVAIRNSGGTSLVELLVVVLIMSFVSAAAVGLLLNASSTGQKLDNRSDLMDNTRRSLERITRVVRMGKGITAGCTSSTLVVQLPKFNSSGFPMYDAVSNSQCLETHTFAVTADPTNNGEFLLTWWKAAGIPIANPQNPMANQDQGSAGNPIVLLKGITPVLAGGVPQVFLYVDKTNPGAPTSTPDATKLSDYTGVIVNLEVNSHNNSSQDAQGNWRKSAALAYKTEVFLRNNSTVAQ